MVRDMATSGARLQLALAPAGTGKTTAMAALAAAWRNSGGTVIGLAPTAGAAEVLAQDLASPTDTIAKLIQLTDTNTATPAPADDPARAMVRPHQLRHPAHRRRSRHGLHRRPRHPHRPRPGARSQRAPHRR